MNFIHSPELVHQNHNLLSVHISELYALLVTAPNEIEHPIICQHFEMPTQEAIQDKVDVELSKPPGIAEMRKAVSL